MAQEAMRGCGYRKVGGLYLVGEYVEVPCDRLPYPLDCCPVCGGGVKVSRGYTQINPLQFFGYHHPCKERFPDCFVCAPTSTPAYIMKIGEAHYKTPTAFSEEAQRLGVSKRIPFIPKELELGKTVLYLAHPKACQLVDSTVLQQAMALIRGDDGGDRPRLVETPKVEYRLGIFSAFIPQRIEKLIWEKDSTPEEIEALEKRGITPVVIKDGDTDHA